MSCPPLHCYFLTLPIYLSAAAAASVSESTTLDNVHAKNEEAAPKVFLSKMQGVNPEVVQRGRHIRSASVGREARSKGTVREGGRSSFHLYCTVDFTSHIDCGRD